MRVSILGPAYPLRGGIAHHVYWLWRELNDRGHTVQVVSFRKLYPTIFFPGTTQLDASRLKLDAQALPTLTPLNPLTWLRAFKQVRAFSPDVIVFQWWQPFFGPMVGVLARLFRRSGLKCIIECHNVVSHEGGPLDRLLAKFALSAADHLIAHSTKDQNDLLAIVPAQKVTVSSLPSLNEFSSGAPADRGGRTILFFGNVRKYKGLGILLAAMPRVLQQIECKLIIVGEFYDSIEKYQAMVREHRIESHVQIDNRYVPNEEVQQILDQADVLVLPYLSATQSAVARIALSNGLPLIASNTGGLTETVVDNVNGLLFPAGDPHALADQILNYFTNNLGPILAANILATPGSASECKIVEIIQKAARN
jgi:glycosyltransferase involved in cell wall biosynthesis